MERELSSGKMVDCTLALTEMIRKKERVLSLGLMVESMLETGILESSTVKEYIRPPKVKLNMESGGKARE